MEAKKFFFCPKCYHLGSWDDYCSECGTKKVPVHEVNGVKVNSAEPLIK